MIYLCYILTGVVLILIQSLVLGPHLPAGMTYDLLVPLVVFLSLYQPNGKTLSLILFLGLLMDGVTGGAMGIYMLIYFWLFVGVQLAVHYLQKDSFVLMAIIILLGVFFEHGFYVIVAGLSGRELSVEADMTGLLFGRLIAAGITGPVLVSALKMIFGGKVSGQDMSRSDLPGAPESRTRSRSRSANGVAPLPGCGRRGRSNEE